MNSVLVDWVVLGEVGKRNLWSCSIASNNDVSPGTTGGFLEWFVGGLGCLRWGGEYEVRHSNPTRRAIDVDEKLN